MRYRYKMSDLDCSCCAELEGKKCPHKICPHIMENLADLLIDFAFREAIKQAENCTNCQLQTLLKLKEKPGMLACADKRNLIESELYYRNIKPECNGCPYPSPGFVCYNINDGTCYRDWADKKRRDVCVKCQQRADKSG